MKYVYRKLTHNVSMIYGFKSAKERYDLITTIYKRFNKSKIYGLLSKESLTLQDFTDFWKFLQRNLKSKYIEFEVILSDARVYERFLKAVKIRTIKTFNGYEAKQITILRKSSVSIPGR